MTRLFGYFFPEAADDELQGYSSYASNQVCCADDSKSSRFHCAGNAGCWASFAAHEADGLLVALSGQPIWQGDLMHSNAAAVIARQIAREPADIPESFLSQLEGAFALAVINTANRSALLATDRMGIERITYTTIGSNLIFGTSALAVSGFPGARREIRDQALYDFLFMHMIPSPDSIFQRIRKLPPASVLIHHNGVSRVKSYWRPRYDYASERDLGDLQSSLKTSLMTAVRDSGLDEKTGAFLSGGLDSSAVAGMLAKQSARSARTFSIGFGETEYDELQFARIASRHFACEPFEYNVKPADIVDAFPKIAASYDEPFGNSSAVPTLFCARLAADNGVTHLLAGDGGDELFAGNERYAKQQVFNFYNRVPLWFRRHVLEWMLRPVGTEARITPLRKLKSYIDQANVPLPDRFETWNLVNRDGGTRLLDGDFAAAIDMDAPLRLMRDVWSSAPSDHILERMLYYDWRFTLADNDLRKVGTMCALAGVRVSYPMLHPDVVNLSIRIPPGMKMKNLKLRSFFKTAMQDFLPEETLRKSKHGFGLPFGVWLKSDRQLSDLIYSLLSDLKQRHIVSATFLTELIDEHRAGHAAYYGYAIWDLAMLEAWLSNHIDGGATSSLPTR